MGGCPRVADWNNDGMKDLLTGGRDGTIRIYLNTGTDPDPAFSGYTNLQAGGSDFIAGYNSSPAIMDWNNDGKKDVVCGESFGKVHLLINTGTDANPQFAAATYVQDGGSDLIVDLEANPAVVDWNRDGRKDLLVGDAYGRIFYFENLGTDADPQFNGFQFLEAGGSTLKVGLYARPYMKDWDNDGLLDIICGCNDLNKGYVHYFHAFDPLSISADSVSQAVGGKIDFSLNAGADHSGLDYLILGSVTGTSPGIPLPGGAGAVLPVNWDVFTNVVISLLNTPIFYEFMGTLDGLGKGNAVFDSLGPFSAPPGLIMSYAYGISAPKEQWVFASNPVHIEILP